MAITTETNDYEILIRFRIDGTVASHSQKIATVKDGQSILAQTVLPPVDLSISDLKAIVSNL